MNVLQLIFHFLCCHDPVFKHTLILFSSSIVSFSEALVAVPMINNIPGCLEYEHYKKIYILNVENRTCFRWRSKVLLLEHQWAQHTCPLLSTKLLVTKMKPEQLLTQNCFRTVNSVAEGIQIKVQKCSVLCMLQG